MFVRVTPHSPADLRLEPFPLCSGREKKQALFLLAQTQITPSDSASLSPFSCRYLTTSEKKKTQKTERRWEKRAQAICLSLLVSFVPLETMMKWWSPYRCVVSIWHQFWQCNNFFAESCNYHTTLHFSPPILFFSPCLFSSHTLLSWRQRLSIIV